MRYKIVMLIKFISTRNKYNKLIKIETIVKTFTKYISLVFPTAPKIAENKPYTNFTSPKTAKTIISQKSSLKLTCRKKP